MILGRIDDLWVDILFVILLLVGRTVTVMSPGVFLLSILTALIRLL